MRHSLQPHFTPSEYFLKNKGTWERLREDVEAFLCYLASGKIFSVEWNLLSAIVRMFPLHHGRFFCNRSHEKQKKRLLTVMNHLLTWYYHDLTVQRLAVDGGSADRLLNNIFAKGFLIKFVVVLVLLCFNYKHSGSIQVPRESDSRKS